MKSPWIALTLVLVVSLDVQGADEPFSVAGEWKTTFGPVTLEQAGDEVTGEVAHDRQRFKGKVAGRGLALSYDDGPTHVNASWKFDPLGNAFTGTYRASNGNRGVWNGWRPDPLAVAGEPGDFSGLWLTDLGLLTIAQDGTKVTGRYAVRGNATLEGEVKGRHLDFRCKAFQTGTGWFDLHDQGTSLKGAIGVTGQVAWSGCQGRKAPEYSRHPGPVAGKVVDGSTEGLLTYSVRAPESFQVGDGKKWPVVVLLHGSNMNARAYVDTLASTWPDIARDYILLGINGELPSNLSREAPAFNYTYVNDVGRSSFSGFPGTDRESPALVGEAMDELKTVYPVKHYFVGGHSQGAFLTYSLLMNRPGAIAGAFPISGGVILQSEPAAYTDEVLKKAQRSVPLAIVHGKNDPLVSFENGAYAANLFLDAGWPAVRFFTDDNAAHMFGRLPVGLAIRWLEVMASNDPSRLVDFADVELKASNPRDALAAIDRARLLKLSEAEKAKLDQVVRSINDQARPRATDLLKAIQADQDNSWVELFLEFRDQFEYADAASDVMKAYSTLRSRHEPLALKAMSEARALFNQRKPEEGRARLEEVATRYYASSSYRLARKWLAETR